MRVCINGQDRQFSELNYDCSLSRLIALLAMKPDRIAVERNGEIVRRPDWHRTMLADGDKLEIVQFVGGGQR